MKEYPNNVNLGFCPRCKADFDDKVKPEALGGFCWCHNCAAQIRELGAAAKRSIIEGVGATVTKFLKDMF